MELTPGMSEALESVRDQFNQNREFSEAFAMMASMANELTQTPQISENYVRNLGDIVASAPQNQAEAELLIKAQITLSPSEFQECVTNNSSPSEVQQVVNSTEIVRDMKELYLTLDYEVKQNETDRAQEAADRKVEKEPMQLGDEYGVMSEIAKALSKASIIEGAENDKVSAPTTPAVEKGESKGRDI